MAEHDSAQERTEQPTPKRLREARQKGQVPRSKELNAMAVTVLGAGALLILGPEMIRGLESVLIHSLRPPLAALTDKSAPARHFGEAIWQALWVIAPFLALMLVAAVLAPVALGGWVFSGEGLTFKWEKLDPVKGLGKIFSLRGLVELLKALLKFLVVAAITAALLALLSDDFLRLGLAPLRSGLAGAGALFAWSFLALACGLVLIAAVDVPFQIWQHQKQLRMTRQEVRDELKDTEGRPEVRARIRSLQQQMAQARMMEDVPKADVVITNPTHYAVALRYDQARMRAPIVLAKGADLIALRIREIAREREVAIVEAPPLARALYHTTELRREIPEALYLAVAQVLAFVYQLKRARREGSEPPAAPDPQVPEEIERKYRRDEP